jgi:hypothetical protein
MQHFKKLKILPTIFLPLLLISHGCKMADHSISSFLSKVESKHSFVAQQEVLKTPDENIQAVEQLKRQLARLSAGKIKHKTIFKRILQQDNKLVDIVASCRRDLIVANIAISGIYKVTSEDYVVKLTCCFGTRTSYFRLFLYTEKAGIETRPLELPIVHIPTKTSSPDVRQSSQLTGLTQYNEDIKELSIKENCTTGYRPIDCGTWAKYRFRDKKFVLKEFWADLEYDRKLGYIRVI